MTVSSPSSGRAVSTAELVLISFLALFLELCLIRWIPGCINVIGYYTNLVLISAVLGLGLGCAAPPAASDSPEGSRGWTFPLRLLVSLGLYALIQKIGLYPLPEAWGEHLWLPGKIGIVPAAIMPGVVFIFNTWTFLPLGRMLGVALRRFSPLVGYSLNLAGSLAGIVLFTVLSAWSLSPVVWFAIAAGVYLGLLFLRDAAAKKKLSAAVLLALALVAVYFPARGHIWSPYYKISLTNFPALFQMAGTSSREKEVLKSLGVVGLFVNDSYFQFAVNLDPVVLEAVRKRSKMVGEILEGLADYLEFPYFLHPSPRVLILGSGLGNDVAAALRSQTREIDAVEIDPQIIRLGRELHPERPYDDRRVRVYNTDARRFLKQSAGPYDLIVFGFLDSHTLFSAFSSIRLDTFVYTRESFEEAARLLAPDGVMVVIFAASRNFVGQRLFGLMHSVFPESARAWSWQGKGLGTEFDIVAGGPGLKDWESRVSGKVTEITAFYQDLSSVSLPTDNWPFLYLKNRWINPGYFLTLLALLIISLFFLRRLLPGFYRLEGTFFLLGAGFMLLQTKSITEMSLLFGSTWQVNSAVFAAFLTMSLLANLLAATVRLPRLSWLYVGLLAAIGAAFFFPLRVLLAGESRWLAALAAGGMAALPVFFSGLVFALLFKDCKDPASALGSNILGLVAGGMTEYFSLLTGFKGLYLFAAAFYVGAWLWRRR